MANLEQNYSWLVRLSCCNSQYYDLQVGAHWSHDEAASNVEEPNKLIIVGVIIVVPTNPLNKCNTVMNLHKMYWNYFLDRGSNGDILSVNKYLWFDTTTKRKLDASAWHTSAGSFTSTTVAHVDDVFPLFNCPPAVIVCHDV